jgi:hypothetical protein
MSQLGISDENILEETKERPEQTTAGEVVSIRYNQTNPGLIRDGINEIEVFQEAVEKYRVQYWGYSSGSLQVTASGVDELGKHLFTDSDRVPHWLLDDAAVGDAPWWVPNGYEQPTSVACDICEDEVPVTVIVTPERERSDRKVCPDCQR